MFVAARGVNVAALRDALGNPNGNVHLADTYEWYPHPARRSTWSLRWCSRTCVPSGWLGSWCGRRARPSSSRSGRGRVRAQRGPRAVPRHPRLPVRRSPADESLLDGARHTHPLVEDNAGVRPNDGHERPKELRRRVNPPLSASPADAASLADVKRCICMRRAGSCGGPACRRCGRAGDGPSLAANEAISNAFVHGRGPTIVWAWAGDRRFMCQIEESRGPTGASRRRLPAPDRRAGVGARAVGCPPACRHAADRVGARPDGRPAARLPRLTSGDPAGPPVSLGGRS